VLGYWLLPVARAHPSIQGIQDFLHKGTWDIKHTGDIAFTGLSSLVPDNLLPVDAASIPLCFEVALIVLYIL